MRFLFKTITLPIAALLASLNVQANVMIDPSQAISGTSSGNGLSGEYWQAPSGYTDYNQADTDAYIAAHPTPDGTFSTSLQQSFNGVDLSTINAFLTSGGATNITGPSTTSNMSDGIFSMSGYIYIAAAGASKFVITHDDAASLTIGGVKLISTDCCGTHFATADFSQEGWYSFNTTYTNTNSFNVGIAVFNLTKNGSAINAADLATATISAVPVPAALWMFASGLLGLGALRKKNNHQA